MLRRLRRGLLWLAVGVLALAGAGAVFQAVATAMDRRSVSPAPGEMVSVGDHRLHLNCAGRGGPTVVLEAGTGYTSVEWSAWILPHVAERTRVCAYDRAGTGWSEPGPGPGDSERIAGELHALLDQAGERGPYVLVGHSLGGLHARVFADRHPGEVAGMVLVDSSRPDQWERMDLRSGMALNRAAGVVGPAFSRLGIPRLFRMFPPSLDLPPLQREQSRRLYYTTPHLVALSGELRAIPAVLEQARKTGTLGDIPLAVVSAADHGASALTDSRVQAQRIEREAQAMQEELTSLSSESTWRVVAGSTHGSLVLRRNHARQTGEEILRVVEAARTGGTLEDQPPRERTDR